MFADTIATHFQELYPFAPIRGCRITRLEESRLGHFALDSTTARQLGSENIGVFVGDCENLTWIVRKLEVLSQTPFPGRWIAAAATAKMAAVIFNMLAEKHGLQKRKRAPRFWNQGNVTFTTPEGLSTYARDQGVDHPVASVLLIDTLCHVHKARGYDRRGWAMNDRPQRIANFRADLSVNGWMPPFLLLTERPAKSVETAAMLSPYCLSTWWFVDGKCIRVGNPRPIPAD